MFTVSLNPTYLCNMRCANCYLTNEQLSSPVRIQPNVASELLSEIHKRYNVTTLDIYGGEISALPSSYQLELYYAIREVYQGHINIVTNYLKSSPLIGMPGTTLSVSYDFEHREHHEVVLRRMMATTVPIHVLILATSSVIAGNVDHMIRQLNNIPSIASVEVKPYSSNQSNQRHVSHVQYEHFIQRWLTSCVTKRFEFTNEHIIKQALYGNRSSMSNDHIYITPSGEFAVLDFDLNDNEYFRVVGDLDQYANWCQAEAHRTYVDSHCNQCQFMGQCLTEHMRFVDNVNQSCNGYHNLLLWYKHERMAN